MAVTYFGLCNSDGTPTDTGSDSTAGTPIIIWNNHSSFPFTCPGAGTQNVVELSAMVHLVSGTPHIRMAIYSTDYSTVVAQGTAEVTVSGASDSWQGHMTAASVGNATLTGGTAYVLVYGHDGDAASDHVKTSAGYYNTTDKTGGYSGALPAGSNGYIWPVRCGVEPAGGSPAPARKKIIFINSKLLLPVAFLGALIRNPKMTRREMMGVKNNMGLK